MGAGSLRVKRVLTCRALRCPSIPERNSPENASITTCGMVEMIIRGACRTVARTSVCAVSLRYHSGLSFALNI